MTFFLKFVNIFYIVAGYEPRKLVYYTMLLIFKKLCIS